MNKVEKIKWFFWVSSTEVIRGELSFRWKCLNQNQLAIVASVSISIIRKYGSGERDVSKAEVRAIIRIADVLGVQVNGLI